MCNLVVGVFKCEGDLASYDAKSKPTSGPVRDLLDELRIVEDHEWGVEAVEPEVIVSDDLLYDIKLNGKSVGYFALSTFVKVYSDFRLPELLTHGPETIVDGVREEYDHQIYVIPLFGETGDVA